jgi:methionyl-tRNA synthetase
MTKPETKPETEIETKLATKPGPSAQHYYLTTPIYYVNARPHLGHAYSTIVCDAIARRKRALGVDTWFLTGTDEHGQKIERSAALAGRTSADFAAAISAEFRGLWDRMGLTYDDYIRTTEERHKRGVQKLFTALKDRGFIYTGYYTGQYCVTDEAYVDGPPGTFCPDCGRLTETVSEENYFFKLSAFERKLLEFYEANPAFMGPDSTRREVISFVRSGLKDLSVSRTSFSWGIPVPGDEKHVIYVWLDALANYITALGYGSDDAEDQARFNKFWPANMHLIGKEISRFHCVYWPAFLMAAGIPTPISVRANGWLLFDQAKMSKSRGNIVRAETVISVLGADALRYFLLREIPFGQDGSFTFDSLVQRYNGDLANGYGNLVSRVVNMVHKYFGGVVPEIGPETDAETKLRASAERAMASFGPAFDDLNFSEALKGLWSLVAETDGYLTANAPWKKPTDRSEEDHAALQARVLATAAESIRIITALVYPIVPEAAAKVWVQLGQGEIGAAAQTSFLAHLAWGGLESGTKFGEPAPLFPRAEKDATLRMQNLEDENNRTVIEAAAQKASAANTAPEAPAVALSVEPAPATASPSVTSVQPDSTGTAPKDCSEQGDHNLTQPTHAPTDPAKSVASLPVAPVAPEHASGRLSSTPTTAPTHGELANAGQKAEPKDGPGAMSAGAVADGTPAPAVVATEQIAIDDFIKVDLRVAQILVAERVPKADKLLRLEVDLGYEKRQILAGIAQYYEPEKLIGRKIVIVANLAPRKMRGLESNGMLLAASLQDGAPVLAGFLEEVPLGARLK